MVVSRTSNINKRAILEIATRKLFQLSEKNPEYRKYTEQLNRRAVAIRSNARISGIIKPGITFGSMASMKGCCSPSCIYKGVLDILVRRNELFTFKEACQILDHCDVNSNVTLIEETIRKYGIIIIGLPECAEEDLLLAVYFFIEDMFGIQPKIELCTRITEEGETDMIGVVFDNIEIKQKIAEKHRILEGSGIEIDTYFDINWIVDGLYCDDSDDSDRISS